MNTQTFSPVLVLDANDQFDTLTSTNTPLFEKRTVVELSDSELVDVNGGSTPAITTSSGYCIGSAIAVTVFVGSAIVGYFSNRKAA